ncbi:MAG: succinylglutamate desuccinylase/aspartoacylase family protein, partial [Chloroflexota bacterium]
MAPVVTGGRLAVGTAEAGPGERAFGHLRVPLPDGQGVAVPCWVLRGRADGPVLYVHSTQHGNEISGIEVVRRVAQALNPRRLRGTVIAVPVANPLALRWRRHHYLQGPEEAYQARPELDLDHWWPGLPDGTPVQRLAHALWDGAVRHATHVLDLHTWNRWQAAATTVRAWHAPSLDLARAFGLWVQARPPDASEGADSFGSVTGMAIRHGKAACAPNFTGQWDIYEPQVRRGVAGLRNVLRQLGMLAGAPWPMGQSGGAAPPGRPAPPVFSLDDLVAVTAPHAGLFLPRVRPEAPVRRGQALGQLIRQDDLRPVEVPAPVDALVYLIGAIGPGADVALPPMMP